VGGWAETHLNLQVCGGEPVQIEEVAISKVEVVVAVILGELLSAIFANQYLLPTDNAHVVRKEGVVLCLAVLAAPDSDALAGFGI